MSKPGEDEYYETAAVLRKCDPLLFLESLTPADVLPEAAATMTAAARRAASACRVSMVETITVIRGEIRSWLYTTSEGFVMPRRHYDKTSVVTSWRQHGAFKPI